MRTVYILMVLALAATAVFTGTTDFQAPEASTLVAVPTPAASPAAL